MNVIFVTTESMLDHSYTMIKELGRRMNLKSYIIAKKRTPELEEFCRILNVTFIERSAFKNPLSFLKELKFMFQLKRQKADLVWFDRTTFYQTLLLKFTLKNYLINVHDVALHPEEKDYHGIITQRLVFGYFKKNVAVMSNTQKEIFEKKYNIKPFVLPLPIIDYYKDSAGTNIQTGKQKSAKIKFFFFGSVMPYKGIEKLLDAASILNSRKIEYELNIYGKLNYNHGEITERISGNKNITHVNKYIDYKDISGIFSGNDVLVIPYIQVSQCGPLLIAYAESVPVICSDLPGFREYVTEGESGLFFENTPESLAEKMEFLVKSPLLIDEMRNSIKNKTYKRLSIESLSETYVSVFRKAIL